MSTLDVPDSSFHLVTYFNKMEGFCLFLKPKGMCHNQESEGSVSQNGCWTVKM